MTSSDKSYYAIRVWIEISLIAWGYLLSKRPIGILLILSVIALVGGIVLVEIAFSTATSVYNPDTGSRELAGIGNLPMLITGIAIFVAGMITGAVAWIAALVNVARLQQWVWFLLVFFLSWVGLMVYLFAGPQTSGTKKVQAYPQPHQDPAYLPPTQHEMQVELPPSR